MTQGHCLVLSGAPGTGKTHLAVAIAYRAIQNGFEALFTTATALIDELSTATRKGKLRHVLPLYRHPHVLVIDEVGYLPYGPDAANVLLVVNDRYPGRRPMIFTANKPLAAWGRVLHDPDLAEAILDRVLERGRHIELRGPSYRTRHLKLDVHPNSERGSSSTPARISGTHTCQARRVAFRITGSVQRAAGPPARLPRDSGSSTLVIAERAGWSASRPRIRSSLARGATGAPHCSHQGSTSRCRTRRPPEINRRCTER